MIRVTRSMCIWRPSPPAGAGKGIAVLIPNLLSYRGNCVVTDPKGELFNLTARHRQKQVWT